MRIECGTCGSSWAIGDHPEACCGGVIPSLIPRRGVGRPPLEGGSAPLALRIPRAMDEALRAMGRKRAAFVREAIAEKLARESTRAAPSPAKKPPPDPPTP